MYVNFINLLGTVNTSKQSLMKKSSLIGVNKISAAKLIRLTVIRLLTFLMLYNFTAFN